MYVCDQDPILDRVKKTQQDKPVRKLAEGMYSQCLKYEWLRNI